MGDENFQKRFFEQAKLDISPKTREVIANLEAQLAASQAMLSEASQACLRARADSENDRRRVLEEAKKVHKFAIFNFAEAMIPIKDSLEMALLHDVPSAALMKEGIEITLKQLSSAFERNGLVEIVPIRGEIFDPTRHQAVALVPAVLQDANTVVTVLQKGYMMADRLLRPAIVTAAQEISEL